MLNECERVSDWPLWGWHFHHWSSRFLQWDQAASTYTQTHTGAHVSILACRQHFSCCACAEGLTFIMALGPRQVLMTSAMVWNAQRDQGVNRSLNQSQRVRSIVPITCKVMVSLCSRPTGDLRVSMSSVTCFKEPGVQLLIDYYLVMLITLVCVNMIRFYLSHTIWVHLSSCSESM